MRATALAPAKVNLFLHVGGPGNDGYHPICSLMVFADIGDLLTLAPAAAPALTIHGPFGGALDGEGDNLVVRAARALVAEARRPVPPLALSLDKQLPVASGLGGGSSDAGATLRLLREALDLPVSDERLQVLAAGLGADGGACLWGAPVIAEGRGERLSAAPGLPPLHAVLARAPAPVSTAEVYRRFDALGRFGSVAAPRRPGAFGSAEELAVWLAAQRNDLEAAAIAVAPEVAEVLAALRDQPEALLARVSGSGGTCFALCAGDREAQALAERIQGLTSGWWVRTCRLGGPWPD